MTTMTQKKWFLQEAESLEHDAERLMQRAANLRLFAEAEEHSKAQVTVTNTSTNQNLIMPVMMAGGISGLIGALITAGVALLLR